jgi:hypothetical protein
VRPGSDLVTTREVLAEEAALLAAVKAGQGGYAELGCGGQWKFVSPFVAGNEEQTNAVLHVLKSRDLVTSIRGPAGSAKTTMMQEAVRAVAALSGKDVFVVAPSSSGVKILKQQGFAILDTFQKLMDNASLQEVARGKIVWIDEAGFLSTRQMRWAVDFAARNDCRLILSGDTRQHHAVERGDAMRLMEQTGAVAHAALTKSFRQQIAALRDAVYDLSTGKTESGFSKLDAFGAIHEVEDNAERLEAVANQHMTAVREDKSCLIVAPTHAECRAISGVVRDHQRKEGVLSGEEHEVRRLEKVNLTESQRRDAIYYNLGHVVEFHRRARGGFKSGERWEVGCCSSHSVVVVKDGQAKILPLTQAKNFNVYTQGEFPLAIGDTLRITKNFRVGTSRFRNNELCTVTEIDRESITVGAFLSGITFPSVFPQHRRHREVIDVMAEMCRNKLREVIFHVFLHAIRQLRNSLVAQIVIPPDDLDPFSRLGMFDNPCSDFFVVGAGRHYLFKLF